MRKLQPKTHPPQKARTAGFIDALSACKLRLFHKLPINLHPIAIVEDLVSTGNLAEDSYRRIRQVHTEERRIRGHDCERVADHRSLRQFHGFHGAL
jgi:hypothetical protein